MPPADDAHSLTIQLATALKERDEARERSDKTHEWYEHQKKRADAAESERDALRTALTEVNNLLMSVPEGADWRQIVRRKVIVALYGEAAWEETT